MQHRKVALFGVERGDGCEEVAGVCEAVRADRAQVRQLEVAAEGLQGVAARGTVEEQHGEAYAALHDKNLSRRDVKRAKLRAHP